MECYCLENEQLNIFTSNLYLRNLVLGLGMGVFVIVRNLPCDACQQPNGVGEKINKTPFLLHF